MHVQILIEKPWKWSCHITDQPLRANSERLTTEPRSIEDYSVCCRWIVITVVILVITVESCGVDCFKLLKVALDITNVLLIV